MKTGEIFAILLVFLIGFALGYLLDIPQEIDINFNVDDDMNNIFNNMDNLTYNCPNCVCECKSGYSGIGYMNTYDSINYNLS